MNRITSIAGFGVLLITLLFATGCSKDKYASKPSLKFKSASSYDVPRGGLLTLRLEYTDAEGDLNTTDSSMIMFRTVVRCPEGTTSYKFALPEVPSSKDASGDIVLRFENGTQNYRNQGYTTFGVSNCIRFRPDTTTFRFIVKDKAGNVSDTVSIDRPIIFRP